VPASVMSQLFITAWRLPELSDFAIRCFAGIVPFKAA
jgi:hypothetical protein